MSSADRIRLLLTAVLVGDTRVRGVFPVTVLAVCVAFVWAALHGLRGLVAGQATIENVGFVALGGLLAPSILMNRFRFDDQGLHRRGLLHGWRTTGWEEIASLAVTRGLGMTTPLQVRTRQGRTHILFAAGGAVGCTRPLLLLAAAAEQGLLPDHVTIELEPRAIWPEATRAVRRLEDAGTPPTRT